MKDCNVFITGGAGFIGSRLARALSRIGARCWVFDNLHPQVHGSNARAPNLGAGVEFIQGDVVDAGALSSAVWDAEPDVVYHLAAETGTGQSMEEPVRYCDVNVTGTARLLQVLKGCRRPPKRLVLASSRAIYGEGAYETPDGRIVAPPARSAKALAAGRFDPELPGEGRLLPRATAEDFQYNPASVYAATKIMQERLVRLAEADASWSAGVLRLQNVYGPGQSLLNPYTGVLSVFADRIRREEPLNIYEDGRIVRDFVYVDDVVDALIRAGASERGSEIFNIGTGQPTTILEAAEQMIHVAGRRPGGLHISGDYRVGDVRHALADIERARTELGWRPATPLSEGVVSLMRWAAMEGYAA